MESDNHWIDYITAAQMLWFPVLTYMECRWQDVVEKDKVRDAPSLEQCI